MPIKRFTATKDNTITNAFKSGNNIRATSSNMGSSDVIEVFSIFAQASTSSVEQARVLIEFPVDDIIAARQAGRISDPGSVEFKLKLFNAEHSGTTPSNFSISIHPLSSEWSEGHGLDMENYSDTGASNWLSPSVGSTWASPGSDYENQFVKTASFDTGTEDLDVDITDVVEAWIDGSLQNYGFLIKLSDTDEDGSQERSFYTKKFFGRGSEFQLKRPVIEAQQSKVLTDDRGNLFKSSDLATDEQNLNCIYFYNRINGELTDIPNTGSALVVQLAPTPDSDPVDVSGPAVDNNYITASRFSKGIYEAKFSYSGDETKLQDVWQIKVGDQYNQISVGPEMLVKQRTHSTNQKRKFLLNITNLKKSYNKDEVETFRVFTKEKNLSANVYTKATGTPTVSNIENLYYKIVRVSDNFEVVNYSTSSSTPFSKLSYDSDGSFFDLDMSILEPNYLYEISFLREESNRFVEQKEKFRFKVER